MPDEKRKDRKQKIDTIIKAVSTGKIGSIEKILHNICHEENHALLSEISEMLKELYDYTLQLSRGNLSVIPPTRKNFLAAGVKQLHSQLNHLAWQLSQISKGDYDQVVDYMGDLSDGFNWMTRQLKLREAQIAYELDHDVLTGLLNRDAFKRKAFELISRSPEKTGVLLFSDLDNLKYVNDTFGHAVGDEYIIGAAEMFGAFRKIDALVSRISGDEFAIYIHGFGSKEITRQTIGNLLSQYCQKSIVTPDDNLHKIRSSIGVAWYPDDAVTISELVKYADYAMYEAKKNNKGSLVEFDKSLHLSKMSLFKKGETINKLIDEQLVHFAFQPVVNLCDGSIYGYEALMRSKIKDFASPIEILAVAAAQSKLYQIESLTFQLVLDWLDRNLSMLGGKKIFINSIAGCFLGESDIKALKLKFFSLFDNIVFEIMEGATEDESSFIEKTKAIRREFGSMVAIDDYGSGHSNEFRLLNLNPDIVKIDRSFVSGIHLDKDKQVLLANVVGFCRGKNIKVLAEGVETADELEMILKLGFDLVQGYFFARPDFELQSIGEDATDTLFRLKELCSRHVCPS